MTDSAKRLQAVREAYWNNTDEDDHNTDVFHDALTNIGLNEPTPAHQKSLFMLIPETILGQGISWSFSDTEVRHAIYEIAEENAETLRALKFK